MKARHLLLALAALSCADPSAPAPQGDLFGELPLPPPPVGLLTCTPLAADSVTQTIGPEGGTIVVGANTFSVPAGALDSAVAITAVAPSDSVNRVQFQPEGLTFQQPASLTMSYANCDLAGSILPKRIAYTTDLLLILDYLPSVDDLSGQTVTGLVSHFSDYAIAW
jgi:hypothetical protein